MIGEIGTVGLRDTCSPPASTLPDLLEEQVSNMFPLSSIEIHIDHYLLFSTQSLLSYLPHFLENYLACVDLACIVILIRIYF